MYQIVGFGDQIVGAPLAGPAGSGGPMLAPSGSSKFRQFPLGFPSTSVNAAATSDINAQPQLPFRGERLIIPSTIAASFELVDVRVGQASQFVSRDPIPGISFIESAVGVALGLDTANVGQLVTLRVTNISGGALTFRATLLGTVVY